MKKDRAILNSREYEKNNIGFITSTDGRVNFFYYRSKFG